MAKEPQIGEQIGGYILERRIGQGGMGSVFSARHALLGRPAAIKILLTSLSEDQQFVSRFFHEAKIVNDVRHPNIVDIIDFVHTPRVAYVMELIAGPPLNAVIKGTPLWPRTATEVCLQIGRALAAVHALGVVHRDLKPGNVLLTHDPHAESEYEPSAKVLDFGIAKTADATPGHRTATGAMMGTPAYMAPEQVAAEEITAAADVYALAEILFETLTGTPVFQGPNVMMLRAKLDPQPPPIALGREVPHAEALEELIRACLAFEPAHRPPLPELLARLGAIAVQMPRRGQVMPGALAAAAPTMAGLASMPATARDAPRADRAPVSMRQTPVDHGASQPQAMAELSVGPATNLSLAGMGEAPHAPASRAPLIGGAALVALLGLGGWMLFDREAPPTSKPFVQRDAPSVAVEASPSVERAPAASAEPSASPPPAAAALAETSAAPTTVAPAEAGKRPPRSRAPVLAAARPDAAVAPNVPSPSVAVTAPPSSPNAPSPGAPTTRPSPSAQALADPRDAGVASDGIGRLRVEAWTTGGRSVPALVKIDGVAVRGRAPVEVKARVGRRKITVVAADYPPRTVEVDVIAGDTPATVEIVVDLE